ncbi:MAG: hypothetical protein UU95_C0019G0006 [Parcubacteria group bacterium GW2011_GWC2_42_12]|uniref:Uncharacterized protein n=1 Tax=Candidatus Falkowbacteria bacterium RIFCSPHIGHO2_02_FULL_42_9 TaxID=1797986 RepID=A0A1F5S6R7_9BACT|nr:MAG: hypothetical protein UU95_C0019G0006 [Parcubacteria group bacterium GW2011_GWC2_42_12]OGF22252.1 MAG: hypothetical protein A3D45_00680 [Candidatus Falkowbacteria bacterium RIFCSPHIGHO2_02_FULL_42_9]
MPNTNNQAQALLDEFKAVNDKAGDYLDGLSKEIVAMDLKYAQQLVKNDISVMQAAKSVLLSQKRK